MGKSLQSLAGTFLAILPDQQLVLTPRTKSYALNNFIKVKIDSYLIQKIPHKLLNLQGI